MNKQITLTVFTDPMMGLSYESQSLLEKVKEKYGSRLTIRSFIWHHRLSRLLSPPTWP